MFSAIGFFSNITCPAASCQLVNCLFSHEEQHHPLSSPVAASEALVLPSHGVKEASSVEEKTSEVPEKSELPGKSELLEQTKVLEKGDVRTKSDLLEKSEALKSSGLLEKSDVLKKKRKEQDDVDSENLPTPLALKKPRLAGEDVDRSIQASKPLAREATRRPISPPPLKSRKQDVQHSPASTMPTGARPARPVPKEPVAEGLNPRLITKPPASHKLRLQLLTLLHAEMVRLDHLVRNSEDSSRWALRLSPQELVNRALNEEEKAAIESSVVYSNVMKNRISALRKMKLEEWKKERLKQIARSLPKEPSKPASAGTISTGLSAAEEFQILQTLITPIASLSKYGYVPVPPTPAEIEQARAGVDAAHGWEQCERCQSRFQVFPNRRPADGAFTSGGRCTYHHGKARRPPKQSFDVGARDPLHACCGAAVGSPGCTTADTHVFKVSEAKRLALIMPFAPTPERDAALVAPAVAFDCEMGYTTLGLELIRLTATAWPSGALLVDVLVRPLGAVLDLNSRFSGIWPQHYADAKPLTTDPPFPVPLPPSSTAAASLSLSSPGAAAPPPAAPAMAAEPPPSSSSSSPTVLPLAASPAAARALLFTHLTPTTPLLGHALDNDLNAARIVHPTLVDTALLFPHPAGLPIRHGLKALARRHLGRDIQMGGARGHDSTEDARAAGELVRWTVKERWAVLRRAGGRFENGELVLGSPGR